MLRLLCRSAVSIRPVTRGSHLQHARFLSRFSGEEMVEWMKTHSLEAPPAPIRLLFLGAPGAGKGTYAKRVAPALGLVTISTGDMVREEIRQGTARGKLMKEVNDQGGLVPGKCGSSCACGCVYVDSGN